ncbi:hypothetical protein [Bradyrhizobium sp. STM 3562]|uniref:hypothetical protein n=1 Tax=Bradyrhizobium sp. STM 3562 TaxID=578924 RepID=UPI00388DFB1C
MTNERELERCKRENARLKELVVRLSEITLRELVKRAEGQNPNSRESQAKRGLPLSGQGAGPAVVSMDEGGATDF